METKNCLQKHLHLLKHQYLEEYQYLQEHQNNVYGNLEINIEITSMQSECLASTSENLKNMWREQRGKIQTKLSKNGS